MSSCAAKCCLVTGGSKGIGKAVVEGFAAEKARVFTCARTREDLDSALKEWRSKGYDVQGTVCDVSNKEAVKELVQKVSEAFDGQLHVLVNNAGRSIRHRVIEYEGGDFDTLMDTNLRSAFDLCRVGFQLTMRTFSALCHPLLKQSAPSSVIFIGSVAAGRAIYSGAIYAMTKASLNQLAMNLACEWAPDGIRVNCIAPGPVDTPMVAAVKENATSHSAVLAATPLKRFAQPEEIASVVLFFSGSGASFITGQTLHVDGGFSIRGLGF